MSTTLRFVSYKAGVTDYRIVIVGPHGPAITSPVAAPLAGMATAYQVVIPETLPLGDYLVQYFEDATFINSDPLSIDKLREHYWIGMQPPREIVLSPDALAQIASVASIHVNMVTLKGKSLSGPLVRGDNYSLELDSAIKFSRSDFPDLPEGATARLTARKCGEDDSASFVMLGVVLVAEGAKVVAVEATSEESREWLPGKYEFDVAVVWPSGQSRTFIGPGCYLDVLGDVTN